MAVSDLADWWDKQKKDSEEELFAWVDENPQWWNVVAATFFKSSIDLGQGIVDVLHFGEGMAEGGIKGFGKDFLRVLVILGPLAKVAGKILPKINLTNISLSVQVNGVTGPCTLQAINNVTSILFGRSYFLSIREIAKGMGRLISSISKDKRGWYEISAWVDQMIPILQKLGVNLKEIRGLTQIGDVVKHVTPNRMAVFSFRTVIEFIDKTGKLTREPIAHTIIAVKNNLGNLQYADYGGKYFNTLDDLANQFGKVVGPIELHQQIGGVSGVVIRTWSNVVSWFVAASKGSVLLIEGLAVIETPDGIDLALPIAIAAAATPMTETPVPVEVVKTSFDMYKARAQGLSTPIKIEDLAKKGKASIDPKIVVKAAKKAAPASITMRGVQFRLNALGFAAGNTDGIQGKKTSDAVLKFQRIYMPDDIDGNAGLKTKSKLVEVCGF